MSGSPLGAPPTRGLVSALKLLNIYDLFVDRWNARISVEQCSGNPTASPPGRRVSRRQKTLIEFASLLSVQTHANRQAPASTRDQAGSCERHVLLGAGRGSGEKRGVATTPRGKRGSIYERALSCSLASVSRALYWFFLFKHINKDR